MRLRTVADLVVPPDPLRIERRPWTDMQRDLLARLDAYMLSQRTSQRDKLHMIAYAVLPLAQVQLMLGCSPATAIEHSAELLETRYLLDALDDTSGLATWFAP